ncbi:hypothetical protein [Mesorhizobium sp.]|uniref:hypothetical protein n=1 Tax=Mesorhizobium sp. TaxID=1871066 RepID=UPI000FEA2F60|nr:hypothetical protein [Mesorhizobium sp.]RWB65302.1 MAG: hypothetical protein EOQ49_32470 [Mesorhizobium sp.]RWB87615.1 MAG: hypothetical protein EOQ52_15515 [Mesorhizobium sp.]RWE38091.1 MAG: hypothetical protein EOS77_00340 [Mesorhizobium sp.]
MLAQPGRKPGSPKSIFSEPLQLDAVRLEQSGEVTISIVADDIYSKNSKQRYQIILTEAELRLLGNLQAPEDSAKGRKGYDAVIAY